MKSIKNDSMQRLELYLTTDKGTERVWLLPNDTLVVPNYYLSEQIKNLSQRRILTIKSA